MARDRPPEGRDSAADADQGVAECAGRVGDQLAAMREAVFGPDPGLVRLLMAGRVVVSAGLTIAALLLLRMALPIPIAAMALGLMVSAFAAITVRDKTPRGKLLTTVLLTFPALVAVTLAAWLARWPGLRRRRFRGVGVRRQPGAARRSARNGIRNGRLHRVVSGRNPAPAAGARSVAGAGAGGRDRDRELGRGALRVDFPKTRASLCARLCAMSAAAARGSYVRSKRCGPVQAGIRDTSGASFYA